MFKLCVFVSVCASLVFYHFVTLDNPQLEVLGSGTIQIFSRERIESPLILNRQDLGFALAYTVSSNNAPFLRQKFSVIDGESITLDWFQSPQKILQALGHEYMFSQRMGDLQTIYAYSGRGRDFVARGRERVNLQIAVRGGRVTVGWPVILGSF